MFLHWREIKQEIGFYENQNKRFSVDDLLRRVFGQTTKYQKQIKENEDRIEKLLFCLMDL